MNYFKDFKRERYHDDNLIKLIKDLSSYNQFKIFEKHFKVSEIGKLISARKKRDYDVHLEFENYCFIIETKVDSKESGDYDEWQTDKIYNKYKNGYGSKTKVFIFLTYGLSEFYIKKRSDGTFSNGAGNINFIHFKCADIQNFIDESIKAISNIDKHIIEWNKWLKFEITKRIDNSFYLKQIDSIITRYKAELNLTDYPVNRLNFSTPEFIIPFYYRICKAWNDTSHSEIGKASLYALGRGSSSTNDSIINFSELWCKEKITFGGIIQNYKNNTYFEFNEDFNLHLKVIEETEKVDKIREFLKNNTNLLNLSFNGTVEYFKQGSYVVYEWDLNIIKNDLETNLSNIEKIIMNTLAIMK